MICEEHEKLIKETISPKFYIFISTIINDDPMKVINEWALVEARNYFVNKGVYEDVADEILKEKCVVCLLKDSTLFMAFSTFQILVAERIFGFSRAYSLSHPEDNHVLPLPL